MDYEKIEQEVTEIINYLRQSPQCLISDLEKMLPCFKNKYYKIPGTNINIITHEGAEGVKDTIEFLKKQKPLAEFQKSKGLYLAAKDHAKDIGKHGLASHEGSDSSRLCDRIEKYGDWQISIAENIGFDDSDPRDIILNMIIDDGNQSRGHRKNIFSEDFRSFGVACGPHKDYKHITVANFAVSYKDKPELVKAKETQPDEQMEIYRRKTTIPVENQKQSDIFQNSNAEAMFFKQETLKSDTEPKNRHRPSEFEMPDGAINCKVKKFIRTVGNKKTTKVIRTFTMKDGTTEVMEEIDEEFV